MGTLKEDLKEYLQNNIPNCPKVFLDFSGAGVNEYLLVYEYGSSLTPFYDYGIAARHIQISTSFSSYKDAEEMAFLIYEKLNSGLTEEERQIELATDRKVISRPKQLPFFSGKTLNGENTFAFNLVIHTNRR